MASWGYSRRLLQDGTLVHSCRQDSGRLVSLQSRRTIFNFFRKKSKGNDAAAGQSNPVLAEFMKKAPSKETPTIQRGDLAPTSIFNTQRKDVAPSTENQEPADQKQVIEVAGQSRNTAHMSSVLDPKPRTRERWERKMVIRSVQRGGRLKPAEFIKRTERENTVKSHNFKTSIKKLGPLARQIAGKTLDDAITQMRFSKKKVAKDVLEHLEHARDEAIVRRGMGLGDEEGRPSKGPTEIQLKDGKRHTVTDPSAMYVDQAFVGRGPFGTLYDFRARGNVNTMKTPWTHLTVTLKEEATRVREWKEREEKRRRQRIDKTWTHLPDRPIPTQQPYYTW